MARFTPPSFSLTMKLSALAAFTLAMASCASAPRYSEAYRDDFLDSPTAAHPSSADRSEYREQQREARREQVQDFSYRRGTW